MQRTTPGPIKRRGSIGTAPADEAGLSPVLSAGAVSIAAASATPGRLTLSSNDFMGSPRHFPYPIFLCLWLKVTLSQAQIWGN